MKKEMEKTLKYPLEKIDKFTWKLSKSYKNSMLVDGIIYADENLMQSITKDRTLDQLANVASLKGILSKAIAMPDAHEGYGFPIGGVAAIDTEKGVISPGGVGFDINCGVRMIRSNLRIEDVKPHMKEIVNLLFKNVPSGLGSRGQLRVTESQLREVMIGGLKWALENGYGWETDIEHCEENGAMKNADPSKVSPMAIKRGIPQLGSLGSGNHFLEVQVVDKIFDERTAKVFGIEEEGQITVMIHTGSRGFGHQIASDYLKTMERAMEKYGIKVPDRELSCVPFNTREGQDYLNAMACAANFAWTNRQMILHGVRESFEEAFKQSAEDLGLRQIYDVCHNIAKIEEHMIDGVKRKVVLHRKGATRAFPPGHPDVPSDYRNVGQPVLIPGTMETASYLLVGSEKGMEISFGSTAHGAGRLLSRKASIKRYWGETVKEKMEKVGIIVKAAKMKVLAEEAGGAYKDVDNVAKVSHEVGIGKYVAKMRPLGIVKG